MFTDGLDESSINWIKQGSGVQEPRARSPLAEKLTDDLSGFPRSPLGYSPSGFTSTRVLPPLRFHSGLITPHSLVNDGEDDDDDGDEEYVHDSESVASVPDMDCGYSEEEEDADPFHKLAADGIIDDMPERTLKSAVGTLNRGAGMANLRVALPKEMRRFTTGGDSAIKNCGSNKLTAGPRSAHMFRDRVLLRNTGFQSMVGDDLDLGTPSAPPIMDAGNEDSFGAEMEPEKDCRRSERASNEPSVSGKLQALYDGLDCSTIESLEETETGERVSIADNDKKEVEIPYCRTNSLDHSPYFTAR